MYGSGLCRKVTVSGVISSHSAFFYWKSVSLIGQRADRDGGHSIFSYLSRQQLISWLCFMHGVCKALWIDQNM